MVYVKEFFGAESKFPGYAHFYELIQSPVIQDMAWKPFYTFNLFQKSLHKYFSLQFVSRFLHNRISNCWLSSYVFCTYFRGLEIRQSWIRKTCNLHRKCENTGKAWEMWRRALLSWRWISWTAQRKEIIHTEEVKIMWKRQINFVRNMYKLLLSLRSHHLF